MQSVDVEHKHICISNVNRLVKIRPLYNWKRVDVVNKSAEANVKDGL